MYDIATTTTIIINFLLPNIYYIGRLREATMVNQ